MQLRSVLLLASQLLAAAALPAESLFGGSRVLYFLDNDQAGNSIVSVKISDRDGSLSSAVRTATGGNGLPQLFAVSQDSVVVSGNYLFTVNAGSNTVSMFIIDPLNPQHPRLVGEPAPTLGHAPVSVTYSPKLNIACVANGGDVAGVTCFSVDPRRGLRNLGPTRLIPQVPSPPPPVGPLIITGDIAFNPSSSALFTTVASATGGPGSLLAYPVVGGQVSHTAVNNTLPDLAIPFSLNFLGSSDEQLFVTNPHNGSPGAALLRISRSLAVAATDIITIPNQGASCWVADVPSLDTLFIMDAVKPTITSVNAADGRVKSQFNFSTPVFGGMDTKADRHYLYSLTAPFNGTDFSLAASPQVLVYDVSPVREGRNPTQSQSFDIFAAVGKIPDLMGLAIYPANEC